MILKEREIDPDIITPVLGHPYRAPGRLITATGSASYFLKEFTASDGGEFDLQEDMKAIFQRYEKGLLLFLNRSNLQRAVLLPFNNLQSVSLKQGKEITYASNPVTSLLIKVHAPKKITRMWGIISGDIIREDTELLVVANNLQLRLITNPSNLESQVTYFEKLNINFTVL
jgi:hypothetical protein